MNGIISINNTDIHSYKKGIESREMLYRSGDYKITVMKLF